MSEQLPPDRSVGTVIANDDFEIAFDATFSDDFEASYNITDDPLASGSTSSDHITKNPVQFSITGAISRTALGSFLPDNARRLEIARDLLIALGDARGTVAIVNGYHVLEGYAVESLKIGRAGAGGGNQISVSMGFKQLITTESRTTQILAENVESIFAPGLTNLTYGGEQSPAESEGVDATGELVAIHEELTFPVLSGGAV